MKRIKFLGASGTVTGSSYVLTGSRNTNLMIDFGMFQGTEEIEKLNFVNPDFRLQELDALLLTHAHLDHCGRIPLLARNNFKGSIYMNKPTQMLAEVVMYDSAKISSIEHPNNPLYLDSDVDEILNNIKNVEYGEVFRINEFEVVFRNAGHIMGSSSIQITDKESVNSTSIVFSGDLGNSPEEIVKPIEFFEKADIVVMESTYGNKKHPDEDPIMMLATEINIINSSGGVLLIPTFSIERTQVILHMLKELKFKNMIDKKTPVYLDSPMAIRATEIYKMYSNLYNKKLSSMSKKTDPFDFPNLHITQNSGHSKRISKSQTPRVIIAGSGMMNGGRIVSHAKRHLADPKTRLLIIGYQGEETLGREIVEGAKSVIIDEQQVSVNATITEMYSLSAHADQENLLRWYRHIKGVKRLFLTHGEDNGPRETLRDLIYQGSNSLEIILPKLNDEVNLF